ncbi:MAG: hypothetical protein B6I28_03940 [Fusobacteriia bacterium 4572_132]|nr:MAG: hypothetical protein B6I28_03940 [Fusobacteriia bacterium 4572_132]
MKKFILTFMLFSIITFSATSPLFFNEGHCDAINDVALYPFGNIAISVGDDESIFIWDLQNNKIIKQFELFEGFLSLVSISNGGTYFATVNDDGQLFVFNYNSKQIAFSEQIHYKKITDLIFSNKENILLSSSLDGLVNIIDIDKKEIVKSINLPDIPTSLAISHNNSLLAVGTKSGIIYLISVKDYKVISSFQSHKDWITDLIFSPDSSQLASVSWDLNLHLHSIKNNALALTKKVELPATKTLNSIDWSSDGKSISVSSSDSNIYLYNAASLTLSDILEEHTDKVSQAIFSHDSQSLISVGNDANVNIWDLNQRILIKTYSGY